MHMTLLLTAWSAWCPTRPTRAHWQSWALGEEAKSAEPGTPDISAIPVIQRRRLSSLSRMAFATAAECSAAQAAEACCIFASRHGELARTVKIIDNIVAHEDVSPTDFSLSVHSTALGLFSIFMKNQSVSTMVVGGEDTFGSALLETNICLARFPDKPVLLVFFDEPLPPPLHDMNASLTEAFSIALLFSAASQPDIGVECSFNAGGNSEGKNLGLDFLKFYLSGANTSIVATNRSHWRWSRL